MVTDLTGQVFDSLNVGLNQQLVQFLKISTTLLAIFATSRSIEACTFTVFVPRQDVFVLTLSPSGFLAFVWDPGPESFNSRCSRNISWWLFRIFFALQS